MGEYTTPDGPGEELVHDSMVGTYEQSTSPFSVNPTEPYTVEVGVRIGVTSYVRDVEHQWQQTSTYTTPFLYTTDTQSFGDASEQMGLDVWDWAQSELANPNTTIGVHMAVWLDNFTHPPVATGVIRLPKANKDVAYTQQQFKSSDWLTERINNIILDLKNTARY